MLRRLALVGVLTVVVAACGGSPILSSAQTAKEVEALLVKGNPGLTKGVVKCPPLKVVKGTTIHCTRTVRARGYVAKYPTTVKVTKVGKDGRTSIDVNAGSRVSSFAAESSTIEKYVNSKYEWDGRPFAYISGLKTECPQLVATMGASVTCKVTVGKESDLIKVTVNYVNLSDPKKPRMDWKSDPVS